MSLDLDDLSKVELSFVMWLLRKCYKCEKEINITDNDNGYLDYCGCIYHRSCPSPRVRDYHYWGNCSLDLKKTIIRKFLYYLDLSTAILQKLRDDCPNLLILLDSTKNETETLNNKEIALLIPVICYKCGNTISDTSWYRHFCGCIYHHPNCPSPKNRTDHDPASCSYKFRAQTLEMYKNSINGNFGEFFRKQMTDKYPSLMKAICPKNELLDLSSQVKLLRQELDNAKQEILQANNEKESNLEESKKRLADAEREKDVLHLLNEELEKNLESTKKQFESANMRLAVITDEINNLRRQSDDARNELPVEEQKEKEFEDEEIVASDKSLLNFEWKKFEERFVALQEKTELLAQQTITRRSAAVMRANNPKILKASETADEVKNSVIETLRTETNRIVDTEQELFPHSPPQTTSTGDSHTNDVNLLD